MSRILVIGDIHGNYRGLKQVLERSNFDYKNDTLISLGDIVDGWSESVECVDELLKIKNLICIRGNHDVWIQDFFKTGIKPLIWTQNGGISTIDSYIKSGKLLDPMHKIFFEDQRDWYIDDENRLFIHAGWDHSYVPEEINVGNISKRKLFEIQASLKVNAGTNAKECNWDRSLWQDVKSSCTFPVRESDFEPIKQFKEVYIGHTTTRSSSPENYSNVWNMDSGSGWHGRLSIMDVDSKEIWQSDFSTLLYPDEKGRG